MFLYTNKKVIGVWTFELSYIKCMEKSEVIQKTLQWKYRLISITSDFTSDWYHFYLFLICIDWTAKYEIKHSACDLLKTKGIIPYCIVKLLLW